MACAEETLAWEERNDVAAQLGVKDISVPDVIETYPALAAVAPFTREDTLYAAITRCVHEPLNAAADILGLKCLFPKGTSECRAIPCTYWHDL